MSTESKAKRVERQARLTLKNCKAQKIDDGGGFLTALGGVTSLAKAAEVTGLVAMAVERIEPWRDEGLVEHEIKTLLSQRLYLGACGHTDALDCSLFKDDPGLKSVLGLEPDGPSLPSQSTHTRMENSMSEDSLNKLEELPLEYFLSRHEHEPRELTIYFDGSAIRTYGSQQNSIYRGGKKYSQTQYFPLLAATKEGHLLLAKLRSGNVSDATSLAEITKLVEAILERWPHVKLTIVMDAGFNEPHLLDFLEEKKVNYVVGYPATSSIKSNFKDTIKAAEEGFKKEFGEPKFKGKAGEKAWQKEHTRLRALPADERKEAEKAMNSRFTRWMYGAEHQGNNWEGSRTVIVRIDCSDKGTDIRCVSTNMTGHSAQAIYEDFYCNRATIEFTIKENKSHCRVPLSCMEYSANRFRFVLQSLIYILMDELRRLLPSSKTALTLTTLRNQILLIPAQIFAYARHIHWRLSSVHPASALLINLNKKLQARTA